MLKASIYSELLHKTLHFGPLIALGNVIVTYGKRFLSEHTVERVAAKRNKAIQKYLYSFVNESLKNFQSVPHISYDETTAPIWTCWLQGEANIPEIPQVCVESIKKYARKHPVIVITLENFSKYVRIAPHIIEKYNLGIIKHCHFADILRINILAQHGGMWVDATMLCTRPIDDRFFYSEFHTIKLRPFGNFVSQCRWAVYCLSTKPGNKLFILLQDLFEQYLSKERYFIDYFMFDQFISMLYEQDSEIRKMIDNVPFSNPNIMKLANELDSEFNEQTWYEITRTTSLFKLNWKVKLSNNNNTTFYGYVKSIMLSK